MLCIKIRENLGNYLKLVALRRYIGKSQSFRDLRTTGQVKSSQPIDNTLHKDETNTKQITLYIKNDEYRFIQKIADKQSLSMSTYIKLVGLGYYIGLYKEGAILEKEIKKENLAFSSAKSIK